MEAALRGSEGLPGAPALPFHISIISSGTDWTAPHLYEVVTHMTYAANCLKLQGRLLYLW